MITINREIDRLAEECQNQIAKNGAVKLRIAFDDSGK